ncbi:DNA adenine methylase [bacterium]|nr:DNA adenine methylase [bacterium]
MNKNNSQKPEATDNRPILVITKYMGSKKPILDFIAQELEDLTQPGDVIVDLMAGTHTIGYAMKGRCRIIANDIQRFSLVIGETLLNYYPQPLFNGEAVSAFKKYYHLNMRHLSELFRMGINEEDSLLKKHADGNVSWSACKKHSEDYPHYGQLKHPTGWPEEYLVLFDKHRIKAFRALSKLSPYNLFSLYYPNTYLGIRQCAEVDSLRFAIDKLCDEWIPENEDLEYDAHGLRCLLLSSLISTLSRINPGPGHWAAFPKINENNYNYIMSQRRINLLDLFIKKLDRFEKELLIHHSDIKDHVVASDDYTVFMNDKKEYLRQAKVIYLDPPYSQGHYSRFYHLIETLVLYDYPEISHNGRYRTDRHQSPFSSKEKIAGAVGNVCEAAKEAGTILVISYSKGGIVPNDDAFLSILRKHYPAKKISVKRLSAIHSKMGQAERMQTKEYIFTCQP